MLTVFTLTLFTSATLLFWVQPMFSKTILPLLGGTPSVWNTCMVFYQAALLAGYIYAHLSIKWLGVRKQAVFHMIVLLSALFVLPAGLPADWRPPVAENPILWLLFSMTVSVGLPFFAVSATAPMLQKWFTATGHTESKDPYFLYAASNLGSMAALIGYPVFVEPNLRLKEQEWAWTGGYWLLSLLILICAFILWKSPANKGDNDNPAEISGMDRDGITSGKRLRWVLLSFAPSSLLLGVTSYITTDIASIPLLWVIPLAVYLLTFVIVFSRKPAVPHNLMVKAQPFFVMPLGVLFFWDYHLKGLLPFLQHLITFFVIAMVCHGELSRSRPSASRLTEFYLWISVGGVLGGLFNALIAPVVFDAIVEYPLAIALACLLRPSKNTAAQKPRSRRLDFIFPLFLFITLVGLALALHGDSSNIGKAAFIAITCIAGLAVYSFNERPIRFGLGIAALMLAGAFWSHGKGHVLHMERNFFGVLQVTENIEGNYRVLFHGTTIHGAQSLDPARAGEPLTYFHKTGPLGQVFDAFPKKQRVAVIGLGAGSMASYAKPGQQWTFYEIDPAVERIARNPLYFTYLKNSPAEVDVVLGDARLSLAHAPEHYYDLIILDAFNSDAIPVHLITKEALMLYLSRLSEGGVMAFHISNKHLDLRPVLGSLAKDAGLVCLAQNDMNEKENEMKYRSTWVVMSGKTADLGSLAENPWWNPPKKTKSGKLWTDDFSNILSVFSWF